LNTGCIISFMVEYNRYIYTNATQCGLRGAGAEEKSR
jgi:hypothetical protein